METDGNQNSTATYKSFGTEYRSSIISIEILVERLMLLENEVKELKSKIQKKCTCKNKSICYSCSNKYT